MPLYRPTACDTFTIWMLSYTVVRSSLEQVRMPKFWNSLLVLEIAIGEELSGAEIEASMLTDSKFEQNIRKIMQEGAIIFHSILEFRKNGNFRIRFRLNK
jgi:hypothetical protein